MELDTKYVLVLIVQFTSRECTVDNYGDNVNIPRECDVLLRKDLSFSSNGLVVIKLWAMKQTGRVARLGI
jgi:hypothetical protein